MEAIELAAKATPSRAIYAHVGAPAHSECHDASGPCYVCAGTCARGMRVRDWRGANFTGQNRVRSPLAEHICEACVYVMARSSPVLGRPAKPGMQFGPNHRNYSHLFEAPAVYVNASKGEKPALREWLAREKRGCWFAAIADSGQKHVLPWAPWNGPGRGGLVLFDEQLVDVPDSLALVETMTELLTAGATKDEIGSGDYRPQAWIRCMVPLQAFELAHASQRGSAWFTLALWLAQRDEEATAARIAAEKEKKQRGRKAKAPRSDGRGRARTARGVSANVGSERAQTLGPVDDAPAERVPNVFDSGGARDEDAAVPRDRVAEQRRLPGFD
jgi:hypothetical protein